MCSYAHSITLSLIQNVSGKTSHISDKITHISDKITHISDKTTHISDKTTHISDKITHISDKISDKPMRKVKSSIYSMPIQISELFDIWSEIILEGKSLIMKLGPENNIVTA